MPGLYAYYCCGDNIPRGIASRMARALRTAPRCHETFVNVDFSGIGVLDRRVFPASGRVFNSQDGHRKVCFQGEIVAFSGEEGPHDQTEAVRRCFCEPLNHDLLARAVGSFVAGIIDTRSNTLEIVTDRNGTYPIYFVHTGELFLFAGQQKSLLATGLFKPDINPLAVSMMLQLGCVYGESTLIKNVRVAPPGSIIRVTPHGLTVDRYWNLEFHDDESCNWEEEVDRLGGLLIQAVQRVFRPNARIGVPVSGGLDSRTLLALSPNPSEVPSFTFGIKGCRDLRYGTDVASALGSSHHAYPVDPECFNEYLQLGVWLTEGLSGASDFHILPYVSEFGRWADSVLNGIGGDVILGGKYTRHPWLQTTDLSAASDAIWSWLATQVPQKYTGILEGSLVPRDAHVEAKNIFKKLYVSTPGRMPIDKAMAFLLEHRTRRSIGCGTELLRWRVESQHPFFDNDFVEAVARLPHSWRKRQRLYVAVIKQCAPIAAKVRWQHTGLPVSVHYSLSWLSMAVQRGLDRLTAIMGCPTLIPRRQMSDFGQWYRGPLRNLVHRVLLTPRACDRGLVSPDLIRNVVDDHMQGRSDYTSLLGTLISLELFCRQFMDNLQSSFETWSQDSVSSPSGRATSLFGHETELISNRSCIVRKYLNS